MDNLIQLIIFLFIIYALLGAVFGKKKQQQSSSRNSGEENQQKPSPDSQDILEMLGFKLPKTGSEYEQPRPMQGLKKKTRFEQEISSIKISELTTPEPMEEIKTVQDSSEHSKIYEVHRTLNTRAVLIKEKIKDPASLRELFLISEILNKPKAHRL